MSKQFPPMGMSPAVWGPIFWSTMHIVSMGYPPNPKDEQKQGALQFYESLAHVIPCPICKEHYKHFLTEIPPNVTNRDTLVEWVFTIHNKVNEQLGYKQLSFDEFIHSMRLLAAKQSVSLTESSAGSTLPLCVGVAIGLALGFGAYTVYTKYK